MTAERDALSYWPVTIVPESKLSHMATAHYGFVTKLSHHEWKNLGFSSLKNISTMRSCFSVERKRNGVFPLMMSIVAKQRVLMAGLVRELAHRHRAVTAARMLEEQRHQQRGFDGFC